jgi:hypothetical protein
MQKRIVTAYKGNETAIITRYNAYFRWYDGKQELFFREYSHALKHAFENDYFIGFPY